MHAVQGTIFFFLRNQLETSPSNAEGADLIPGWGAKISHASWPNKLIKQKQYCNKFNEDFKNGLHQKKKKSRKIQLSPDATPARLPGSVLYSELCDGKSCPPSCCHSLVLEGLSFASVLDLVLTVTASIRGSKKSRRVLQTETRAVCRSLHPIFPPTKDFCDWWAHVRDIALVIC